MIKQRKNKRIKILFVMINIGVVGYIAYDAFQTDSAVPFNQILSLWRSHWYYLLIALTMPLIALVFEGLKYYQMIHFITGKRKFKLSLKTASIGKYYDNITPLGSGGQAAQVYYLYKHGIPSGVSGGITISAFSMMQIAFSFIALITFIFFGHFVFSPGIKIAAYIGSVFAVFIPFLVILFSVFPKTTSKIIYIFLNALHHLKIMKEPLLKMKKVISFLKAFKHNLHLIYIHPTLLIQIFLLSIMYQVVIFSIPYFAVSASGYTVDYVELFVLSVFVYNAIAFIPTPGNSGGAELSFTIIFSMLSGGLLFWTMILWRLMSYYTFIIIGFVLTIKDAIKIGS